MISLLRCQARKLRNLGQRASKALKTLDIILGVSDIPSSAGRGLVSNAPIIRDLARENPGGAMRMRKPVQVQDYEKD